ncbi:SDR family oxidoreductase [Methylomonas sp. MS20]|uniref:SDR family oxidoreductase n=1 Tax=unclassified Methylomonas TaxID=2608980 RepID=UPI00143BA799|nr:SDR family oxidoreductase [Methylomonas sp. MV1]MDT4331204.1 SDR family oxidoreductase [Methylomonas sp. MV1]NJA06886.1 SDR family oxidoreductase [Methylococcaceae bacterium WWC4]
MAKIALITGASRGVGKAVALRLARDGFDVAVNYAANAQAAEEVAAQIRLIGRQAVALPADVSDPAQVAELFANAERALGRIDVLVNNAGIMKLQMLAETDDAGFDDIVAVNLKGTFNTLRLAATHLNDAGRIVNFSTSAIGLALPGYTIYNAAKAGVEALSRTFANELRGRNITVNCVAPGPTDTELFFHGKTAEQVERLRKLPPLERLATPDDIAAVVAFLAGPDGGWINGQVLRANGGLN